MSQHKWEPPISQGEARLREWEDAVGFWKGFGLIALSVGLGALSLGLVGYFLFSALA